MFGAKSRKKTFVVPIHLFDSTSTVSGFGDGQYSLVSFLFAVIPEHVSGA